MFITYIFLALYLVVLLIITITSSRRETDVDFINGDKKLSSSDITWTTFASVLTGYNFVIGVTFSFLYGFWYIFAFIGAGVAFWIFYKIYKKELSGLQKENNLFSVGDYFNVKYGKFCKNFINIILCVGLLLFLVLQISINTELFSGLLKVEKIIALFITSGVVCLYLWFGGFKASVKTDIFQGVLILPIIILVFVFPVYLYPDITNKVGLIFNKAQIGLAFGLGITQFLTLLGQAESFQRIFASKDKVSLKRGLLYSFALIMLVTGSIAYLGINFKFSGLITDPSSIFIKDILSNIPKWLSSLLSISLIAAFMGTIDSSAFAFGSLVSGFRHRSIKKSVSSIKVYILLGIIFSALASFFLVSFLSSVFALISLISIIGAALFLSFVFRYNKIMIEAFLISGTISFIIGLLFNFITDNPLTTLIPVGVGIFTSIIFAIAKNIKINIINRKT